MDISTVNNSSIKIRFRHASFVIDPSSEGGKTPCDAVVLLSSANKDLSKVSDYRLVINGPGEYEISGVKISGTRIGNGLVYNFAGDGLGVIVGKTKEISMIKEELKSEFQVAVLNADSEFSESAVTRFEPKVVVLYGEHKSSGAKTMGKESLTGTKKHSVTKDKLPEGMEVVVLG